MPNLLEKSSRFQQDCDRYLEKIKKIPDGEFKQEVTQLLSKLIAEVKKLDNMHMEMIYTRQRTSMGADMKQDILSLRKKLDSKLKSID